MNRMASILFVDGQEVDVPCRYVEPTRPNKGDKVGIIGASQPTHLYIIVF